LHYLTKDCIIDLLALISDIIYCFSQDGKSNIWSIEPKMVIEEDDEDDEDGGSGGSKNKNLVIGGAVFVAAIGALPLFTFFSKMLPDPSNY
jgi:hypothetical protein